MCAQLGDNTAEWFYMYYNIQGILQFQIFQVPMVGADTCGFRESYLDSTRLDSICLMRQSPEENTDEELCNRWMQLSAFAPFYRNHNQKSALSQEPYRWDSVANASRTAIAIRYSLLPYWVRFLLIVSHPLMLVWTVTIVHLVRERVHPRHASRSGAFLRVS